MPKLLCPCGYIHDLSPIPDAGWLTVRDADYEQLIGVETERAALSARVPPPVEECGPGDRRVGELHGLLYECPSCGRLLWRRPGDQEFRAYIPDRPVA